MSGPRWLLAVLAGAVAVLSGCQNPSPQGEWRLGAAGDPLHPKVRMETTLGDIVFELDAEKAPAAVLHFIQYVQKKFYDGTIFHRVKKDSMIQGGGYSHDMIQKPALLSTAVADGWGRALKSRRGTIAMLRGQGPAGTGTAEFFINVVDNENLDEGPARGRYGVFGTVVEGMDTVEKVRNTPVGPHPEYAAGRSAVVPIEPVVIKRVSLLTPFDPERVKAVAASRTETTDSLDAVIQKIERQAGAKMVPTESGLRYVDLVVGKGPLPFMTDRVEFQYRGTLVDGTEFESTYLTEPAVRQVNSLIPGLQEAITTMNEGGRRILIVPPELAYGQGGIPGLIPPDSTLVFELELLAIR